MEIKLIPLLQYQYFEDMQSEMGHQSKCSMCRGQNQSKRYLFAEILKKLQKELISFIDSPKIEIETDFSGFEQLMKIMFFSKPLHFRKSGNCKHKTIFKILTKKLKCRDDQFNQACQALSLRLAERSYQLQILSNQIKNISDSIAKRASTKSNKNTKIKTKTSLTSTDRVQAKNDEKSQQISIGNFFQNRNPALNVFPAQSPIQNQSGITAINVFYPYGYFLNN